MKKLFLLLCTVLSFPAFAADGVTFSFTYEGQTLEYTVLTDKTVCTKEEDYESAGNFVQGDLILPEKVTYNNREYTLTEIGRYGFYGCSSLTSITIPSTVTTINYNSFNGCVSLKEIIFEDGDEILSLRGMNDGPYNYPLFSDCPIESLYIGRNLQYSQNKDEIRFLYIYSPFQERRNLTTVTIGNKVKSIPDYLLYGCSSLTSIDIPNSVTSIGECVFKGCENLIDINVAEDNNNYASIDGVLYSKDLTTLIRFPQSKDGQYSFPGSVTSIEESAFENCTSLTSIDIPNSVISIGNGAFAGCSSLTSITIPNSVTSIGNNVFYRCFSLKGINFEDGDKTLTLGCAVLYPNWGSNYAEYYSLFRECNIKSLYLGRNLQYTINPFYNQKNLTILTIGNKVKSIRDEFKDCPIESLTINCTIIESWFSNYSTLKTLKLGNDVVTIGSSAFSGTGITEIIIPAAVKEIGNKAFYGCSIKELVLPESLTSIGSGAFYNNDFSELTLPESIESVGENAFYGCPIEKITINTNAALNGTFQMSTLKEAWLGDNVLSIPNFAGAAQLTVLKLPASLETLPTNAFKGCAALSDVTLPTSLKTIGSNAFYGCSIKELVLPESLTSIGSGAFQGTGISEITVPASVKEIGNQAFADCPSLTMVSFPGGALTSYSGNAFFNSPVVSLKINATDIIGNLFKDCSTLTEVEFGDKVASIGSQAFYGCSIKELILPESLTSIGSNAFSNNNISSLVLTKSLKTIGSRAFGQNPVESLVVNTGADIDNVLDYNNLVSVEFGDDAITIPVFGESASRLKYVTLPSVLESIPSGAFSYCVSLEEIELPVSLTSVGTNAFSGATALNSIVLPERVANVGENAFAGCTALRTAHLSKSLTSIPASLFENCISLEKVYIPDGVQSFGSKAFRGCTSLRSLMIPDGVTEIPANLMNGCSSLAEILIPNSVAAIGEYAFNGCSSLKNIDLGTSVYDIANYAFYACPEITDIHSMAKNPPYAYQYTFPTASYTKATVTVQEQSLTRYTNENPWYRFNNYMTVSGQVSLSHYQVDMAGNEVFQLGVYGANSEVEWTSSNPAVAYANNCGLIVAMGITGSTVITASVDGEEVSCRVTVSAQKRETRAKARKVGEAEEKETIEPVEVYMEGISGNPPMVNARLVPVGACTVIDWTSSDDSLATVENGIVTVLGEGDVEFGVETENGLTETLAADTENIWSDPGIGSITDVIADDAETAESLGDVYDLAGRCILRDASRKEISRLNRGVYIVGGRKVYVK